MSNKPKSKFGLAALGIVSASAVGLCIATTSFILPAFRKICLPYVPATNAQVANVIQALHTPKRHGMSVVDIGSGDGRIVIASAAHGFHATGYELNTWLILFSKYNAWKNKQSFRSQFCRMDLWKANYAKFDNAIIFGVEEMMADLEKKLLSEMKKGSKVVACRFPLPSITPSFVVGKGVDTVWTYNL